MDFRIIKDFPNYAILEVGEVKNLKTGRILKSSPDNKGYMTVRLYNNGRAKTFKVHRLVAEYFIPNTENKPQVNHIDGDKSNNDILNLEWVTNSENQIHAIKTGLRVDTDEWRKNISNAHKGKRESEEVKERKRKGNPKNKSVIQLSVDGDFVRKYISTKEAERETGIRSSNIIECCKGRRRQAKGFKWVYEEDYQDKVIKEVDKS